MGEPGLEGGFEDRDFLEEIGSDEEEVDDGERSDEERGKSVGEE